MVARVKLALTFQAEDRLDVESVWAEIVDRDTFKIANIPFYVQGVAFDDVVRGKQAADGMWEFVEVISSGGHSTIRVLAAGADNVHKIVKAFKDVGCDAELSDISTLIAVDVPPQVLWSAVSATLISLGASVFDYEEAAISRRHVP